MNLSFLAAVLLAVSSSAQTLTAIRSAEMTAGMDAASAGAGRFSGMSIAPLPPALPFSGPAAPSVLLAAPALSAHAAPAPVAARISAAAPAAAAADAPTPAAAPADAALSVSAPAPKTDSNVSTFASGRALTARLQDASKPGADGERTEAALDSFYSGLGELAAPDAFGFTRDGGAFVPKDAAPTRFRATAFGGLRRGAAAAAAWTGLISFSVAEAAQAHAPGAAHGPATAAGLVLASKALVLWYGGVAALHAVEEGRGHLWDYFGRISGNAFLQRLRAVPGFVLIVLPALALQLVSAWNALVGGSPFWLGALIGARLGDAFFSHFRPASLWPLTNPGLPTARVYLVDGLLLSLLYLSLLVHAPAAWGGLLAGAAFFAVLLPLFKLTGKLLR